MEQIKEYKLSADNLRACKFDLAMKRMRQIAEDNPYCLEAAINLSTIHQQLHQFDEAKKELIRGIQINPFDYRPYYNMFVIECGEKNWNNAAQCMRRCLSNLYLLKVKQGESQDPLSDLKNSQQLWPENTGACILKALHYLNSGSIVQASDQVSAGLVKCIRKEKLFAVRASLDSKMNKAEEKDKDAKSYGSHLLTKIKQPFNLSSVSPSSQEEIKNYLQVFNALHRCVSVGSFRSYNYPERIIFQTMKSQGVLDLDEIVIEHFGLPDLNPIFEDKLEEDEKKQTEDCKQENNFENEKEKMLSKLGTIRSSPLYPPTHSKLACKLVMAQLLNDREAIGKMDPYVVMNYGKQKHKSKVCKKGGTFPAWENEVKIFDLEDNPAMLKMQVYDRETFKWKDDSVGEGQLLIQETGPQTVPLYYKREPVGKVVCVLSKWHS